MKRLISSIVILCILFGIASGIYFQFSDDNANIEENSTNWKKGFFRLMFVLSILVGILGGTFFAYLAKKGKLVDDEDPPPKYLINPKSAFLSFSTGLFGFVWLVYFIIQFPIYYAFVFVLKGFTS